MELSVLKNNKANYDLNFTFKDDFISPFESSVVS